VSGRGTDFFISHAGRDTAWAEWLAWQLQEAGHSVELDVWDWAPGEDFVARMTAALERADRLLAVCTEAYFSSAFGGAELRAAFAGSVAAPGRIVPVLVEPVTLPPLYAPLVHVDLAGLDEATAAARLRARLTCGRPTSAPPFPRAGPTPTDRPAFAGAQPAVWQVPPRNPRFTGRDGMLAELRRRLRAGEGTLVVQALYGLGGVGKTQLAIEYAHRFAADYDLVWWIDAEQPVLLAEQLAALASRLHLPTAATVTATVERLLAELRGRESWLLVFDNAERPGDVAGYRPSGAGHVLITSRSPGWGALGGRLEVDVLTRAETIALLRARIPTLGEELADAFAAELGDLPLAAAQAVGYLEQTDLPPADYLRRFRARRATLLARGEVVGYRGRLDTTWSLSVERLRCEEPAAVQLLELAAFLAPEPIPLHLFSGRADVLAEPLRSVATDPDALADTVGALVGYSLARRFPDGFQVHRLVQAVHRQRLPPDRQQATADQVLALLAAAAPGDPSDQANGPAYARLAAHVLATAPLADHAPVGRQLVLKAILSLQAQGDSHAGVSVGEQMLGRWRAALGPDHPDTLTVASRLTLALNLEGAAEAARSLAAATLQRCSRVLGRDHPTTLVAATALALALSELREAELARPLGQDTLARCRRVLGPDQPTTLLAAAALTSALVQLGEAEPARALGQDTLARCRRVLAPGHPTTLAATISLCFALSHVDEAAQARALSEEALRLCRRTHGPDHPTTLWAAHTLTLCLLRLDEAEPARALAAETLQRCRRVLGPDHPTTLAAAAALPLALTRPDEAEPARALAAETLQRCSQVFGADRSITLLAAASLTSALARLGEAEQARALGEDTLERCRRVLGWDYPTTLVTAAALTHALAQQGESEAARALGEDTLQRCRRVFGPDHPITRHLVREAGIDVDGDAGADQPGQSL
jgi:TIR domain/Tetratricopeptide repeat